MTFKIGKKILTAAMFGCALVVGGGAAADQGAFDGIDQYLQSGQTATQAGAFEALKLDVDALAAEIKALQDKDTGTNAEMAKLAEIGQVVSQLKENVAAETPQSDPDAIAFLADEFASLKDQYAALVPLILKPKTLVSDAQLRIAFQTYTRNSSSFLLTRDSRIVLETADENLTKVLDGKQGWLQKLRYASGFKLPLVAGVPARETDILLSNQPDQSFLDAAASAVVDTAPGQPGNLQRSIQKNVLREGYQYQASRRGLVIKFNQPMGALRGVQTLTTLLLSDGKATGKHDTVVGATALDFPIYENRRFMLDVARQYMSVDQIIGYMDKMSLHKLNELHLHLNDSAAGPDGVTRGYFRLFSENYPGLVPPDNKVYTRADWDRLETAALDYGIEIVPEFDTPGHSMAFLKDNPNLPKVPGNNDGINTANPGPVVDYIAGVFNEFRPWFKSNTIHIGGDEVFNGNNDHRVTYLNLLYDRLLKSETNPTGFENFWVLYDGPGDPIDNLNKNIGVEHWINEVGTGRDGRDKWIDIQNNMFYFVPQVQWFQRSGLAPSDAHKFYQERLQQFVKDRKPAPDGMAFAVWNDVTFKNSLGVDFVNAGISKSIPGMGLINWRGLVRNADASVVPYADLRFEELIKVSQEMTSYLLRDKFPGLSGQKALDILMKTARHRYIFMATDVTGRKDYLTQTGPANLDWMAWDEADMAKAFAAAAVEAGGVLQLGN